MSKQQNSGVLVKRNNKPGQTGPLDDQRILEEVEKISTNSALASQFPDWDLKPPANLVKRRGKKLG